jgi:hypothetical protein
LFDFNPLPVDGAANAELIELIAKAFGAAKRDVSMESGERSKLKRIAIERWIAVASSSSWNRSESIRTTSTRLRERSCPRASAFVVNLSPRA